MSHPDAASLPGETKKPKMLLWLGRALILGLIVFFVQKYVLHYFSFTAASYGDFWPKASWLFPHLACGALAILIGPLQFWPKMRANYLQAHRIAGRVYVVAVLVGSIAAYGLASKIDGGSAYSLGLAGLATAWLTTTGMGFVAIRRKNLEQHKQWMVRSYVVTFAFVTFRLCDDSMRAMHIMSDDERSKVLAWACWAVPLLVTELIIQGRAVFKARN